MEQALAVIRQIATVEQARALAARGSAPKPAPRCNGHIHLPPNFSAFGGVSQALSLAAGQGVRVIGASNYYDYRVYVPFVEHAGRLGIFPLFGLEIISLMDELVRGGVKVNDPGNPGRVYICGKGITGFASPSVRARELLDFIRRSDEGRMREMTSRLSAIFARGGVMTALTYDAIVEDVVARAACPRDAVVLQERHVAQAFQEALWGSVPPADRQAALSRVLGAESRSAPDDAVKMQTEIRSHLMKAGKEAFVEERFLSFEQARELILELGGIPCYPTLADGAQPICPYEQDPHRLVANLRALNVHCAELIPIRNKPDVLAQYVTAFRRAGIVVTAGTEHNTLDLLPLEPRCVGGAPVPQELHDIFWEGACVQAAHQFLVLHGQAGFVDAAGNPNGDYRDAESRIAAFASLGAAVIARYFEKHVPA
jgi:hypothetical protein